MILVWILLVLVLIYLFFLAPRMFHTPDKTPFLGRHYAHRGLFDNDTCAPENSLPAFEKAVNAGYGIEFDVQLTKDEQLVVFHDAGLQRMCGIDGKVWEYTLAELRQMRLAHSDAVIPTLEEVLEVVDGRVPLIIEYKLDKVQTRVCQLADRVLDGYKGVYCVESFHPLAVAWYRRHRPDVLRGQLCEEYFRYDRFKGNPVMLMMSFLLSNVITRPDFVAYNQLHTDNISRRIFRKLGGMSVAFTVKSEERYKEIKDKYDVFIFDSFLLK